jgi:hypothetical protein
MIAYPAISSLTGDRHAPEQVIGMTGPGDRHHPGSLIDFTGIRIQPPAAANAMQIAVQIQLQ